MCVRCSDKHAVNYMFLVVKYNHRRKNILAMCAQERRGATMCTIHTHTQTY